jgi:hypothetical protein
LRSLPEILFRLKQEAGNAMLLARPGTSLRQFEGRCPRPVPERVRGTPFAAEVERLAGAVLEHRFPLLGLTVETGPEIAWRRDYVSGIESPPSYFRLLRYLDPARVGDHKVVWELNRLQHLTLLAQAFLLTDRAAFLDEIVRQWESWHASNPFLRGMNWASALEVAFRALSWMWVDLFAGDRLPAGFRRRFLASLYSHGLYLERNLSVYFSPNTHLLGEAVALHALGVLFPSWPRSRQWEATGGRIAGEEILRQVRDDGSHFEQSSYYHVYALDFFLLHHTLARQTPGHYLERLTRMAEYLDAITGPCGDLPLIGDDDGGRVFHPYGPRERFGRATLATCAAALKRPVWLRDAGDLLPQAAWWLGERAWELPGPRPAAGSSRLFPDAGAAVLAAGDVHIVFDAGPMGAGTAGHGHADALSLVVRAGGQEILIDPGTYTYVGDARRRDWFRSTAAHNTVRIDGLDQARPAGPFRWAEKPAVELLAWRTGPESDAVDALCQYRGFRHRRRLLFARPHVLFVLDEIDGPAGAHEIEQFWHAGQVVASPGPGCFRIGGRAALILCGRAHAQAAEAGEHGWRSHVFAALEPAPVIRAAVTGELPIRLAAALDFSGGPTPARLRVEENAGQIRLALDGGPQVGALFTPKGSAVLK